MVVLVPVLIATLFLALVLGLTVHAVRKATR